MTDSFFARTLGLVTGSASGYVQPGRRGTGLDLSVGEARFPFPPQIRAVVEDAVMAMDRFWYSSPAGEPGLRAAYAATLAIDPDHVLVCAGGKEAAWLAVRYLVHRDGVRRALVPVPGWEPYTLWLTAAGCQVIGYDPTALAGDAGHLDELLHQLPDTELPLLILNYPQNPTGVAVSQQSMDRLVALAREHELPVVSDEVYRSFTAGKVTAARAPSYDPARHVVVDSTSKWLTTAGLRVGFLTADPATIAALTAFRATYASCTSPLVQRVAEALITSSDTTAWLASTRATIDAVRIATAEALASNGVPVVSHGSLYLWAARPDPAALQAATPTVAALLTDGAGFGAPGMVRACTARAGLDPVQAAAAVVTALRGT